MPTVTFPDVVILSATVSGNELRVLPDGKSSIIVPLGGSGETLAEKIAVEEFDIPITAAEIIENGLVNKLGSIVYRSEEGGPIMLNFLKNRPEQVSFIAKQLTNKLLEEPKYLKDAMGDIKVTAETALKNARKERRKKAKKAGYTVANTESLQANQVLP